MQTEGKEPKNQRHVPSYMQESHESTKLEVIIYTQRAWCRPVQALCLWPQVSMSPYTLRSC